MAICIFFYCFSFLLDFSSCLTTTRTTLQQTENKYSYKTRLNFNNTKAIFTNKNATLNVLQLLQFVIKIAEYFTFMFASFLHLDMPMKDGHENDT